MSSLDFLTQQLVKSFLLQRSREILLKVSGFSPVLCSPQKRHMPRNHRGVRTDAGFDHVRSSRNRLLIAEWGYLDVVSLDQH